MFKKGLSSFLNFLRDEYKILIFFVIFYLVITFPLPYYVFTSGGITDLSLRFEIEDSYKQEGSYNLSYVNQLNGNVLTYFLSCVIPDYERVEIDNYQVNENESFEDMSIRDHLALESANQNAVLVAYSAAEKEITINDFKVYVMATYEMFESDVEVKVGDIIQKVDGNTIEDPQYFLDYIKSKEVDDTITLEILRNNNIIEANVKIKDYNGTKMIGLLLFPKYDYEVSPKITFNFADSESGSSAGLMTTLAIYDALIEEDLTHGYKIAGTGTIYDDGTVGPIGGVSYKLGGAVKGGAKIFFVPTGDNYNEAIKIKNKRNYDIEIVEVEKFEDAVNYLKNIKTNKE